MQYINSFTNRPPITVLTCCYNSEKFVSESIVSVLNQSYRNFEYILVDDGSMDGTNRLLNEFANKDSRIKVFAKSNTGLTDSLNFGLSKASGNWIARLDADDIALPSRLENQFAYVEKNDCLVLLGGGCIEIDEAGKTVKHHRYPSSHENLLEKLEKVKSFFPHSSAFIRRTRMVQIGGYDRRYPRSQDCDLFLRMAETGKIACLNIPVVKLRKHSGMISNTDAGRLQQLYGAVAVICHHRRKLGMEDPAKFDDKRWSEFTSWAEKRLEEIGYFEIFREWSKIRSVVMTEEGLYEVIKRIGLLIDLVSRKEGRRAIRYRLSGNRFPYELAKQYG